MTLTPKQRIDILAAALLIFLTSAFLFTIGVFARSIERMTDGALPMLYVLLIVILPIATYILFEHLARGTIRKLYAMLREQGTSNTVSDVPKDPLVTWIRIIFSKED